MTGDENRLPAGTVTFLFTDIERSTESAAALGDERYAEALQAHRSLLRPALTARGGVEVGTEGDGFFVAFARAGDAVSAAIEGQRAMETHTWGKSRLRVRMGLHTGEALLVDDDYVGHDVHLAKRVCDAGHGGQVLLSQTTADLVRSSVTLKTLGLHRLKDLGEPQPLFQVTDDGLETEFPPLRTLDTATHNLPVQLTTFVGREKELGEISELLATHRLVTLTGVGGCGKTRLAIHAAAAEIDSSPDGVYFVDLSRLSDEVGLVPAMSKTLGLDVGVDQPGAAQEAPDGVKTFLSRRNALLVLDNCEHLISAAAEIVEEILTSSPFVRVLVTSREALDVPGEHTWPIPSLSATGEAARLFAERAASARGGFTLDESNRSDVDAICERLDGIPLAIELAAAQTGHLSPRQIAERLDQRFMILTGGRRRVQRQQTLQATMDWSWDLLDEREQILLRRLSVFQGGCTLEAAEAVCSEDLDVVAGLRSLVAKSLLNADHSGQQTHYRLLETVRLYAEAKQAESGESEAIRTRHRDHVLSWLEAIPVERTLWGPIFRSELLPEEDNIRAAVRWSEAAGDSDEMARILCATDRLWVTHLSEGRPLYVRALQAQLPGRLRGRLVLASAFTSIGTPKAMLSLDDEAIALLDDAPDPWLVKAHAQYAVVAHLWAMLTNDHELAVRAEASSERAIELGRGLGPIFEAAGHTARANVLMMQLRSREATDTVIRAVRLSKDTLLPEREEHVQFLRGLHHLLGDDWPPEYDSELREITADVGVSPFNSSAVLDLVAAGDLAQADRFVCEFVSFYRDRLYIWSIPFAFFGVALAMRARFEDAAIFLAAAMQEGFIANAAAYALYRHWLPKVREALGPERARELRDQGRAMNHDQLFERLLALHAVASTPGSDDSKAAASP